MSAAPQHYVELPDRGCIAITGADRARWLHAMVSNHIQGMQTGQSCYCFLLDAQGHIQADAYVIAEESRLLLNCEGFVTTKLMALLDRYIFMDQVELADVSAGSKTLAAVGPGAELSWIDAPPAGAKPMSWDAYTHWRIEQGIPRFGEDIGENTLAQETGQLRAVHFSKGCYLGQEIVERVRSRGKINRHLAGFEGKGLVPGAKVMADGTEAGWVTSVSENLALGYLRREFEAAALTVDGRPVKVRPLPGCNFDW